MSLQNCEVLLIVSRRDSRKSLYEIFASRFMKIASLISASHGIRIYHMERRDRDTEEIRRYNQDSLENTCRAKCNKKIWVQLLINCINIKNLHYCIKCNNKFTCRIM